VTKGTSARNQPAMVNADGGGLDECDIGGLGDLLYGEINSHSGEVKAPLAALALLWLNKAGLTHNQLKFGIVIASETLARRTAAAGVAEKQIVEGMGLNPGMGSNQTFQRTRDELLGMGLLHRIRGHQRRANIWWLDWVNQAVGLVDDDKVDAEQLLVALQERSYSAEARHANKTHLAEGNRGQQNFAFHGLSLVMPADGDAYASTGEDLYQQPGSPMPIESQCVSPRSIPTTFTNNPPVNAARADARLVDPIMTSKAVRTADDGPRRLGFEDWSGLTAGRPAGPVSATQAPCRYHGEDVTCGECPAVLAKKFGTAAP